MLPPRTRPDPLGYYARLGLEPTATQASIVAAFRAKARMLHPDVPKTGNAEAFVAVRQAYDVLSNSDRREAYDRRARATATVTVQPAAIVVPRAAVFWPPTALAQLSRFSGLPVMLWVGLGAFLCLCLYQLGAHLLAPLPVKNAGIRPNAATVAPLSPSARRAVLYGPAPVRLAGTPNFYVLPAGNPTILFRHDPEQNKLVPLGQLPPFSAVQAVRVIRQTGMLEVLVNDRGNGFVSANHLTPGNAEAARLAYCGYNSGPAPSDGELLQRRGTGGGMLVLENRAVQPAVVKLRDQAGAVMLAVYLRPGGRADLEGLPEGLYRPEFAIGELWSRACNSFAAGMQAQRMNVDLRLQGSARVVVSGIGVGTAASDISNAAFEQN
jgi:hypothetical protein